MPTGRPNVIWVPLGETLETFLLLPVANCYLVRSSDRWVVVDTGPPGNARRIQKALEQHGIGAHEVALILLTHGHFDHIGSALELRRLLGSGVKIAMHPADQPYLSGEWLPMKLRPSSLVGAVSLLFGALCVLLFKLSGKLRPWPRLALDEVIWLEQVHPDAPCDLKDRCGVDAVAFLTPGHSPGSISVRFRMGEMVMGELISRGYAGPTPRGRCWWKTVRKCCQP